MKTELENVVVNRYVDGEGNEVAGAYTTVDGSYLVVRVSVFKDLLSSAETGVSSPAEMSFEEAEKKYGDAIIDKFLDANGMLSEFGERCLTPVVIDGRKENQKKATKANVERGNYNQAVIIKAVMRGMAKLDIERSLGFSRPTINKAVNALTKDAFKAIWKKYRDTVFADMEWLDYKSFMIFDCNYKKWLAHLSARQEMALQRAENKAMEEQMALKKAQEQRMSAGVATLDSIARLFELEL